MRSVWWLSWTCRTSVWWDTWAPWAKGGTCPPLPPGNVVKCFCALVVTAKLSVDEWFMHHFLSSACGCKIPQNLPGPLSPGLCINRMLVLLPRILLMTVIFCLTLVVVRWGLIPTTSGSCSCHEHTANLATGVSRQPVLDCGTIFHPDCGGRDFP